jgi:hypothetical protein
LSLPDSAALASFISPHPYVVAAFAIAGKIIEPFEFLREPEPELAEGVN